MRSAWSEKRGKGFGINGRTKTIASEETEDDGVSPRRRLLKELFLLISRSSHDNIPYSIMQ
jgi:hypothetical protein